MVELLALYGDGDERIGAFNIRRGIRKGLKVAKKAAKFSPHYVAYRGAKGAAGIVRKKMAGDERVSGDEYLLNELLGAAKKKAAKKPAAKKKGKFLPGLKKVGKVTSGFTTGLAKVVGVPDPLLKAMSKIDPTKGKKASATKALQSLQPSPAKEVITVPEGSTKVDFKKIAIIGGIGVGSLVALNILFSRKK